MATLTRAAVAAVAATALLAGCGGPAQSGSSSSAPGGTSAAASGASAAPTPTGGQTPPQQLVIDVTIKGGQVTPTNAAFQAKVGEPIVVRVSSDVADELHVHSVPEHEFEIAPKDGQSFQFAVEVPGRVDIELHKTDRTIGTVAVS